MLLKYKLPLLIIALLCLNVIIYFRAVATIVPADWLFGECARNSGRTSALINLILLFMLGYYGLKTIYKEERKRNVFRILITLFAVNHLIHFLFVSQNFRVQLMDLDISDNLHGFITYLLIVLSPVIVWSFNKLNRVLYYGIILHLFNVTYLIADTFYGRYKPVDPAYLHRLGVVVMMAAVVYVLYRVYRERLVSLVNNESRKV